MLTYRDIPAAHDFLVNAFGFVSGGVHRTPEGQAVHGEVRAGDSANWLHRVAADQQLDSPLASDVASSGLMVYVDYVDGHFQRARSRVPASTASPSISRTGNVNTGRGTWKVTGGGLQRRLRRRPRQGEP